MEHFFSSGILLKVQDPNKRYIGACSWDISYINDIFVKIKCKTNKKHKNRRRRDKWNTKMDDGKQIESLKERAVIKEWVIMMGPQHL